MKKIVFCFLLSSPSTVSFALAEECGPVAKYYCACENITHGGYYQISFVKLDFKTGKRSVVTPLKAYNLDPIFEVSLTPAYNACVAYMQRFPECQ